MVSSSWWRLRGAITFEAKVIVMDEPTAALSSSEVQMLYRIIGTLRERGVSIIYISHKLEEVFQVADRITVLRDGFQIVTDDAAGFTSESLINLMVGRELRFIPMRNEAGEVGEVLFEVRDLRNPPMVDGVSFQVHRYEILGITGLVGAGRSETAQTIFGLMKRQGDRSLSMVRKCGSKTQTTPSKRGFVICRRIGGRRGCFRGKV